MIKSLRCTTACSIVIFKTTLDSYLKYIVDMAGYVDIEQRVKRELPDEERVYVNGILQNIIELGNYKTFWKYVVPKTRII